MYLYIYIYTYRVAQGARGISRDESTRGAISGVCFAPGSRDQLRGSSLRQKGNETRVAETNGEGRATGDEEPSIVTALPGMHI